jgi:photosystem II stability/assembly factor-like uncharacterized protein
MDFKMLPKFALLVILFCVLVSNNSLLGQWKEQHSGTKASLKDICFVDSLNGWIVGDSVTILHTTNGGQKWIKQSSPTDTINLLNVRFIDNKVGYITSDKGSYLKTQNGGLKWNQYNLDKDYFFRDICFVNKDTGWIVGYDYYSTGMKGAIFYTSNGGDDWIKQLEVGSADNLFNRRVVTAVNFLDKSKGWALVSDCIDPLSITYIYRTQNGGRNWFNIGQMYNLHSEIICITKDTLWASPGGFAISTDGGINWKLNVFWGRWISDIASIDGLQGWITTSRNIGQGEEDFILYTSDGGENWSECYYNDGPYISCLENYQDKYLWAAGVGGNIIRYSKYSTPVEDDNITLPAQTELLQNYPNPFNPYTTIKFTIPVVGAYSNTPLRLVVYDILGREINTLVNENKIAGEYSVIWDGKDNFGRDVPSGIYFCNLKYGDISKSKKMILVK